MRRSRQTRVHGLLQTLNKPLSGYWDGGSKKSFQWTIEPGQKGHKYVRVGSWEANNYFTVKAGKTNKQTLANVRRSLARKMKRSSDPELKSEFEYI